MSTSDLLTQLRILRDHGWGWMMMESNKEIALYLWTPGATEPRTFTLPYDDASRHLKGIIARIAAPTDEVRAEFGTLYAPSLRLV